MNKTITTTLRRVAETTAVAALALIMGSCATGQRSLSADALNGEWTIVDAAGSVKAEEGRDAPFLGFDTKENNIYGSTGCNRLTGTLQADAEKQTIDFSQTGSTRMMCADMDTEQRVLNAMSKARQFAFEGDNELHLIDNDGNVVMQLKKK